MTLDRMQVIKRHLQRNGLTLTNCSTNAGLEASNIISDKEFRFTVNSPALTREQRIFYEKNGFLVIPDLLGETLLDSFIERFIDLCDGRIPKGAITMMKDISLMKKGAKGQYLYNKIQDILFDEVFEQFFFCDKLLDVVECFTGPNVLGIHSMLINKPPDSGALTSRHPLHQDLYYFPYRPADRIVAAWTALEEVTMDNGCLIVVPGSHTGSLLNHGYPNWEGGVNKAYHGILDSNYKNLVPLTMRKGDTVFFHPLLIHGSGVNTTQGFRKAISGHFASADCHMIDVKGTVQDEIAKEIEDMARRRGFSTEVDFRKIWQLRSRLVRGSGDE